MIGTSLYQCNTLKTKIFSKIIRLKKMLRGAETRMSEKVLTTMYRAMRTNDESTDGNYVRQWTSESYTLQEDKEMEG